MAGIFALWLPILLSAVVVFAASSIIHMFLPYHKTDFKGLSDEDGVMEALRRFDIPPGDYVVPYAGGDPEVMKSEAFRAKVAEGPTAFMTVMPKGDLFNMTPQLIQWLVYCLVVSFFAAYITQAALDLGADRLAAVRFAGFTAFVSYGAGIWQRSIWFKQAWSTTLKSTFDALVYGLLTGGVFGLLFPS